MIFLALGYVSVCPVTRGSVKGIKNGLGLVLSRPCQRDRFVFLVLYPTEASTVFRIRIVTKKVMKSEKR